MDRLLNILHERFDKFKILEIRVENLNIKIFQFLGKRLDKIN